MPPVYKGTVHFAHFMFDTLLYSVIFVNTKLSRKEVIVIEKSYFYLFFAVYYLSR